MCELSAAAALVSGRQPSAVEFMVEAARWQGQLKRQRHELDDLKMVRNILDKCVPPHLRKNLATWKNKFQRRLAALEKKADP